MDYIDYELDKYYRQQEKADAMDELGFEDEEEYDNYLADLRADYEEAQWEARRLEEEF